MPETWYNAELRKRANKIKDQKKEIKEMEKKLKQKDQENEGLRDQLREMAERKAAKKPKFSDYSLTRQEKLKAGKSLFRSPGRKPKDQKMDEVTREKDVYPEGILPDECILAYTRFVTHIRDGNKEVVLYRIYRKGRKTGKLPHVMHKGEYGVEVAVTLAFLVYSIGLSQAQAAQILAFFCNLEMNESEVDALLNQISKLWKKEFETLCDLILFAFVVHVDETGWKEGVKNCYAWIFKSLSHTVLLYGKKRNEEVLDSILPRGKFKGKGITDCYRIYEKYFETAQKCWAHFLRKIIKLMLLHPGKKQYRAFFEELFAIFSKGKEVKQDQKLTQAEKEQEAESLKKKILTLCTQKEVKLNKNTSKDKREFVNLQKNLVRNIDDLFTFVLYDKVEPTNNKAEQGLRFTAKVRNNYQTSKTAKGSERRSVIASVLASLKQNLPEFSLKTVTEEVIRWRQEGQSLFRKQLGQLQPQRASP